jgi:TruD family tRNA pseudouridine synthase
MSDRHKLQQQQAAFLKEASAEYPELFTLDTYIDNNESLSQVGIELPDKDSFPLGYLKLWPQDFIVEEIGTDGTVYTIKYENPLSEGYEVDPTHRTIYATLVKCGIGTLDAIEEIAKMAGCGMDQIKYAGLKDRDAMTAQRISFRDVKIEALKNISSPHFFLKDVVSGKGVAQKGELSGNRFTVLIRTENNLATTPAFPLLTQKLSDVKNTGFHNFYYLQRFGQEFGTSRINNFEWSLAILKGDYKQAVLSFLSSTSDRELPYFKQIRSLIGSQFGNWDYIHQLLSALPIIFATELKVVSYLKSHPEDYIGALNTIEDQIRLWVYSLSSYLFNRRLSDIALNNEPIPQELPLFLNDNPDDWMMYAKTLRAWGVFPPPFKNFKPFRFIELKHRTVPTKESVTFNAIDVVPEGIRLTFSLGKGCYATSFLAHLFNLVSGAVPTTLQKHEVISPETEPTVNYFRPVIQSKENDRFNF